MLVMILGETFERVKSAESDGGLEMAELLYGLAVQLCDAAFGGVMFGVGLCSFGSFSCCFVNALASVGGDEGDEGGCSGDQREDEFEKV
jgi:hypothetical protein